MAFNRTITAPGVEIREFDKSRYTSNLQQTCVLVNGFASQGEENTTMHITSKTGLINQFGKPTNEAERYFYAACNEVLNQGGVLYATRMPYDNDSAGKYNYVSYKVSVQETDLETDESTRRAINLALRDILGKTNSTSENTLDDVSSISEILENNDASISKIKYIEFGELSNISSTELDKYITEETVLNNDNIWIVDKLRGQYGKSSDGKECIGIIPVITTATNALYAQDLLTIPAEDKNAFKEFSPVGVGIKYKGGELSEKELAIPFSSKDFYADSISRLVSRQFPAIGYVNADTFEKEHFKKVGVVVLKAYVDNSANNLINFEIIESFVGSLDKNSLDPVTGKTNSIETIINVSSEYIYMFTGVSSETINDAEIFAISDQPAASLGFTEADVSATISLSSINNSLNVIFEKNADIHEKSIDIVVDAGMSNIAQYIYSSTSGKAEFDPMIQKVELNKNNKPDAWLSIIKKYDTFCKNIRKDCIFICDGIRSICLTGAKKVIRPSCPTNTIDGEILPKLKYMSGLNSNYTAGYCNWFQVADDTTGKLFWCPPSIQAMGCYIYTDINYNYWDAPAGQRRGVITALDCAFNPSLKQAGAIYDKGWNYAINYADVGLILEGQKTMQQKLSAFDRVNVRRLFLHLERQVYQIARTFVYEPNTAYTRQKLVDLVTPILESVRANGGCYAYKVICDESINTPQVIDNNELRIKIGIQPVKTAEFILVEFYALRTNGSWDEMGM